LRRAAPPILPESFAGWERSVQLERGSDPRKLDASAAGVLHSVRRLRENDLPARTYGRIQINPNQNSITSMYVSIAEARFAWKFPAVLPGAQNRPA
jgi:hypothetical protein